MLWLRQLVAAASAAACLACGPPKQAEDPHEILGEDWPEDDAAREQPGAVQAEPSPTGARAAEPKAARPAADPPASRAECEAAAERMVELGLEATRADPPSTERAGISPEQREAVVSRTVDDCLRWGLPRSEVRCVARARRKSDIGLCTK